MIDSSRCKWNRIPIATTACLLFVTTAQAATHVFGLPRESFAIRSAFVSVPGGDPFPASIQKQGTQLLIDAPGHRRICLNMLIDADAAGTVIVTMDNGGAGYEGRTQAYSLLDALLHSVVGRHEQGESEEQVMREVGQTLIAREEAVMADARRAIQAKHSRRTVQLKLQDNPVTNTEVRIEQITPDPPLGFGQDKNYHRAKYRDAFMPLFDYKVVPFYLMDIKPEAGEYRFECIDPLIRWCRDNGVAMQGSPLIWFLEEQTPAWLRKLDYEQLKKWTREHVDTCVRRYAGTIDSWVVVNEAHGWANSLNLSHEQLLEISDIAVRAARAANPACEIIVNCCLPWGDYVQWELKAKGFTPYAYFDELIRRGCPFDQVGLQMYDGYAPPFPHRDLTAMNALLERLAKFGKPMQVCEFAAPSGGGEWGAWHGKAWTPQTQADYCRNFFEIACSKPYVKAFAWWFPQDARLNYWDHLGLLTTDQEPKPALAALINLKKSWMTTTKATSNENGWLEFTGPPGRYRLTWNDANGMAHGSVVRVSENSTPLLLVFTE